MTDPTDDILLTAYALGEVDDPAELARVRLRVAADPAAARAVDDLRAVAAALTEGLRGEPEVGLTAIQYAGIERRLAADAAGDAPYAAGAIGPRRNWGLWGSVAASTLIVATVMATALPRLWPGSGAGGTGVGGTGGPGGKGATNGAASGGESEAVLGSGAGGLAAAPDRTPPSLLSVTRPVDPGDGDAGPAGDPTDWPMLRTSAGGLPWPAVTAADTGLREPAFVVAGDFPLAVVPPGAAGYPAAPGTPRGALAAARAALAAGRLPAPGSVRSDELVNAVRYDDAPIGDDLVSATIESAVCPWDTGHLLVRVAVRSTGRTPGSAAEPDGPAADGMPPAPAIVPLVRDLRLSVEVNPAAVAGYRVLGYENAPRSWVEWAGHDDRQVFAAGRAFTVLIEVVPAGQPLPAPSRPAAPLRYRKADPVVVTSTEMLTVGVEYCQGPMGTAERRDLPISVEASAIELASPDFRTAAAAAALGASLRQADPAAAPTLEVAVKLLSDVTATAPTEDRQALLDVAKAVQALRRP
jgi:hypothetical protein